MRVFCLIFSQYSQYARLNTWMFGHKNVWLFLIIVVLEKHWGEEDVYSNSKM